MKAAVCWAIWSASMSAGFSVSPSASESGAWHMSEATSSASRCSWGDLRSSIACNFGALGAGPGLIVKAAGRFRSADGGESWRLFPPCRANWSKLSIMLSRDDGDEDDDDDAEADGRIEDEPARLELLLLHGIALLCAVSRMSATFTLHSTYCPKSAGCIFLKSAGSSWNFFTEASPGYKPRSFRNSVVNDSRCWKLATGSPESYLLLTIRRARPLLKVGPLGNLSPHFSHTLDKYVCLSFSDFVSSCKKSHCSLVR